MPTCDFVTDVTGLTIIETLSLHDGEPMHWWTWGGGKGEAGDADAGHRLGSTATINRNITGAAAVTSGDAAARPAPTKQHTIPRNPKLVSHDRG